MRGSSHGSILPLADAERRLHARQAHRRFVA
jgi:hypothetical protein